MKPTPPNTETMSRRESAGTARAGARLPQTDYQFHPGRFGDYSGRGGDGKRHLRAFRGMSDEYFDKEARGHFATEAAFFGLIAVTVSVPLFQVATVLAHWVL